MKWIVFIAVCVLSTSAFGHSQAELKRQIAALKVQQLADYNAVLKDLKGSREYAVGLWTDLETAKVQVGKIGEERDGWKAYGEDQHEKFINAEKRVSEEKVKKQRWFMLFSGLAIVVGLYFGLKFFTPIGRFIP